MAETAACELIRLFMAIDLPKGLAESMQEEADPLRRHLSGRWLKPRDMHLTLRFIGEYRKDGISELTKAMERTAGKVKPFRVVPNRFGCFPNPARPRVLWVGIGSGSDSAVRFEKELAQEMAESCPKLDSRRFIPHVTLCRIKKGTLAGRKLPEVDLPGFQVESVALYSSLLTPEGAVYEELARSQLGPA